MGPPDLVLDDNRLFSIDDVGLWVTFYGEVTNMTIEQAQKLRDWLNENLELSDASAEGAAK